jgi:hypothetical protein
MKLLVKRENGSEETIDIGKAVSVFEGSNLDTLTTPAGMDFFFTKDGHYDGWGGMVPPELQKADFDTVYNLMKPPSGKEGEGN